MQIKYLDFDSMNDTRALVKDETNVCPHFHRNFELIHVMSGVLEVTVDGITETVNPGEFALVLSSQVHAFRSIVPAKLWVCIFDEERAKGFAGCMAEKKSSGAKFTCDAATVAYLHDNVISNKLLTETDPSIACDTNMVVPLKLKLEGLHPTELYYHLFRLEACLLAICACYMKQANLITRRQSDKTLAHKLLGYISENFLNDITLHDVARDLGYSVNYLSKCQRSILGVSFRQFLNQQRLAFAQELISKHKMPLAEVAARSGFGSVRNFNRVFKDMTGKPPKSKE